MNSAMQAAAQSAITGKPNASPSLRARNLRMRDNSHHSNGAEGIASSISHHTASSSSLSSIASARNGQAMSANQGNHFRFAGKNILDPQAINAYT